MKHFSILLLPALALCLSACGEAPPPSEPSGESPPPAYEANAPVGILKSQGQEVLLHATPDGPRYSLRDDDGSLVARELTREELAENFPEIYEDLKSLWAGNEAGENSAPDPLRPNP